MSAIKESLVDSASLRCDCLCTTVVIDKFKYAQGKSAEYNISFQNSSMRREANSLRQRLKAAWCALVNKPYSYADVWIEEEKELAEFVQKIKSMIGARQLALLTGECQLCDDCPDGCPLHTPNDSRNDRDRLNKV